MRAGFSAIIAAAIPYVAVAVGLYAARSAWAAILLYHLGIVAALSISGWREPLRLAVSGWGLGAAAACAAVTALAGTALYLLWPYVDATPAGLGRRLLDFDLGGSSWLLFAAYYSTVHPFLEELFWRGDPGGDGKASLWRDAAFAGYHVPVLWFFIDPAWIVAVFVILTAASWMWRWTTRRFGGLGVPLVSHAVADISIVVAATFISRAG
jgi:membrane protease YdiL (CAAX protease family)